MSGKQEKKLRRLLRKQYGQTIKEIAEVNARMLKTKPRWIPMFVWLWGASFFVKIKK